jgi:hypothetical protein
MEGRESESEGAIESRESERARVLEREGAGGNLNGPSPHIRQRLRLDAEKQSAHQSHGQQSNQRTKATGSDP